jgi:hypothetical protein
MSLLLSILSPPAVLPRFMRPVVAPVDAVPEALPPDMLLPALPPTLLSVPGFSAVPLFADPAGPPGVPGGLPTELLVLELVEPEVLV